MFKLMDKNIIAILRSKVLLNYVIELYYIDRSTEDMKLVLTMVISLLNSGKKDLVNEARRTIEAMKKSKSLDWKV